MGRLKSWLASAVVSIPAAVPLATDAAAQDKVKVGVFAVASSCRTSSPLKERGYFKEQNIERETRCGYVEAATNGRRSSPTRSTPPRCS